ncbi:MAG: hypothetical protein AB8B69_07215 [Chitinophagales bacterium]
MKQPLSIIPSLLIALLFMGISTSLSAQQQHRQQKTLEERAKAQVERIDKVVQLNEAQEKQLYTIRLGWLKQKQGFKNQSAQGRQKQRKNAHQAYQQTWKATLTAGQMKLWQNHIVTQRATRKKPTK